MYHRLKSYVEFCTFLWPSRPSTKAPPSNPRERDQSEGEHSHTVYPYFMINLLNTHLYPFSVVNSDHKYCIRDQNRRYSMAWRREFRPFVLALHKGWTPPPEVGHRHRKVRISTRLLKRSLMLSVSDIVTFARSIRCRYLFQVMARGYGRSDSRLFVSTTLQGERDRMNFTVALFISC